MSFGKLSFGVRAALALLFFCKSMTKFQSRWSRSTLKLVRSVMKMNSRWLLECLF